MLDFALRTKLRRARRYWAFLDASAGAGWLFALCLLVGLICFHVDRFLVLSPSARVSWDLAFAALIVGGGMGLIGLPLLRRRSDEAVATRVERRHPILGERLLSTVELADAPEAHRAGISTPMVAALADETARVAGPLRFESAFGFSGLATAGGLAALMTAAVLLHQALFPEAMRAWWLRMTDPYGGVPVYRATRVQVSPLNAVLLRGAGFALRVATEGRPAREAILHLRFGDSNWSTVRLTRAPFNSESGASGGRVPAPKAGVAARSGFVGGLPPFEHRFVGLTEPISYYATAGDGRSDVGHARVVDAPTVVGVDARLRYPPYMARPEERFAGSSGSLRAPIGTRVAMRLAANKPLSAVECLRDEGTGERGKDGTTSSRSLVPSLPRSLIPWRVSGSEASGDLLVTKSATYRFQLRDREGFGSPQPAEFAVQAVRDAAPEVQIARPAGDRELVPDGALPLEGVARDDYGVRLLQLRYSVAGSAARAGTLSLARGDQRRRQVPAAARWNLASLGLTSGDTVRYYLEAIDFDNVTGPNVGRSSEYRIHIVDRSEMERRLAESREDLQRALETLIRDQRAARERVEALRRTAPSSAALAEAERRQRALAQQALEAAARLQELSQSLENNRLASPAELAAQAQAQQTLSQLGNQAMPQAADQIAAAQNAASARPSLSEAARRQEEILQQLQRLRRELRPMDDLERLAAWAARLAQVERDLRRQTEVRLPRTLGLSRSELAADDRAALDRLAEAQALARQSTAQLQERLSAAAESLRATDPNAAERAREAGQQMQSLAITERQSETEGRLRDNALASAGALEGALANDLQRIADDLSPNRSPAGSLASLRRQLERALRQLEQMMARQRDISRQTGQQPDRAAAAELARQEQALRQQAQRLAQSLARATSMAEAAGLAAGEMNRAAEHLDRAQSQLGSNAPGQAMPAQQNAQQAMEQAAEALREALNELAGDRDRDELRRQLAHLAVRQRAVNTALQRLDERAASGSDPDGRRELDQLAGKEEEIQGAAGGVQQRMSSPIFRETMEDARAAMQRARQGLQQHQPGGATRQSGERAARLLDQMARALQRDQGQPSEGGGGNSGGGGGAAQDISRRLAELRLLRSLEQDLREETGELDQQPESDSERREGAQRLGRRQGSTRTMTERAARALQRFGDLARRVGEAGSFMGEAQQGLQRQTTGTGTQQAQDNAIRRLSEAIQQAQQMAQQMSRGGNRPGRQPGSGPQQGQNGGQPALESLPRRGSGEGGSRSLLPSGQRGFGPLSPREQRSLREGWREKIPPDYADLINEYYRSLSRYGR